MGLRPCRGAFGERRPIYALPPSDQSNAPCEAGANRLGEPQRRGKSHDHPYFIQ